MKKTLLLATVATVAFTMNANASVLTPYISAKLSAAQLNQNSSINAIYSYGSINKYNSSYDDSKHVWGTSLAAGISYGLESGAIRAELEWQHNTAAHMNSTQVWGYDETNSSKRKIKTHAYMLNAYYDFDTGTKFTPYIGAGIGYAKTKISAHSTFGYYEGGNATMKHTNLAWQIGAGISYAVTDKVSVDAGYRYIDYGKFKVSDMDYDLYLKRERYNFETTANEIYAGLRYSF